MTTLDDVLRSLLDPRQPWKSQRTENGFTIRYRAIRLSHGLALAYQPGGVYSPAETLTLSRPDVDVSPVEVRTVAESLARVLGWPGLNLTVWDERRSDRVQRIMWLPTPVRTQTPSGSIAVHQAVVWDRDERGREDWLSLGIATNRDEAAGWLHRDQQLYMLRGAVVTYEVKP